MYKKMVQNAFKLQSATPFVKQGLKNHVCVEDAQNINRRERIIQYRKDFVQMRDVAY